MAGILPRTGAAEVAAFAHGLPREELEAVLDLLPTPVLLIEPGTARVTFANAAADRMAGGEFPRGKAAEEYHEAYFCTDRDGVRIPDEQMPGVRASRGERLEGFHMDWHLPGGTRSLLLSADTVRDEEGNPEFAFVMFDDFTSVREAERARDESLALLDTLFSQAPVGLAFFDRDLRYVRVNHALAEINGIAAADHVGRTVSELLPEMDPALEESFRHVLETGEPLVDVEVRGRTPSRPGEERVWIGGWYPVRHRTSGEVLGLGAFVVEVTERAALLAAERRARERAASLARAGELLSESLDEEEVLRAIARVAVPEKADWCAVDVAGPDGRIRRLVVAHSDPAAEDAATAVIARWPVGTNPDAGIARVIRTGRPLLVPVLDEAFLRSITADAEHRAALRRFGLTSLIIAPLIVRRKVVGAMTFALAESGRRFDDDDLALAVDVARRVAVALDNARLYRERDHIAETLQRSLLPPRLPEVPGFELAGRYRAAGAAFDVGGDFYDVFSAGPDAWFLAVGDVCGKGPEAAALTAMARYTLRATVLAEPDPARVLRLLNDAVRAERTGDRFLTLINARLDVSAPRPTVSVAAAGHPPGVLVRAGSEEHVPLGGRAPVIGIHPDLAVTHQTVELHPGDVLLLFTDGVTDAGAPQHFLDGDAIAAAIRATGMDSAAGAAAAVEAAAVAAAGEREPRDDIALLALRCSG